MSRLATTSTESSEPVPGTGAPGILDSYRMLRDRRATIQSWLNSQDTLIRYNLFGRSMIMALSPDAAEAVAINRERAFAAEPAWDFLIGVAFRRGVLLMDFDEHRAHRAIMQQAFTSARLHAYVAAMQPLLHDRIEALPVGKVRIARELKEIMLDVAVQTFVGVDITDEELAGIKKAFHDCLGGLSSLVRYPIPGGAWARAKSGRRYLESFFHSKIASKREGEVTDLFAALCQAESEEGDVFTDADVVNHMIFLLFAAHDTSSTAVATMAYHLARHPQWQTRVRREVQAVSTEATYESLGEMPIVDRVLKESLRLNPPVPIMAREALVDTVVCGHLVPRGSLVVISPEAVQMHPSVWRNPNTFDPDRFTDERAEQKLHRYAWMPFGAGVHKCIGMYFAQMEIKLIMRQLVRTYSWSIADDYVWKTDPRTLGEPKDGLLVDLQRVTSADS